MRNRIDTKSLVIMSFITAMALIVSYIEVLIPLNPGVPGIKLGLANLVIIIVMYYPRKQSEDCGAYLNNPSTTAPKKRTKGRKAAGISMGKPQSVFLSEGEKEALYVNVARILLSGFLFGNLSVIIYSLSGGLFSFIVMVLLKRSNQFHIITVSAVGGVSHNIGQLLIAAFVVKSLHIFYYAPVLILAGLAAGVLIGGLARAILPSLERASASL